MTPPPVAGRDAGAAGTRLRAWMILLALAAGAAAWFGANEVRNAACIAAIVSFFYAARGASGRMPAFPSPRGRAAQWIPALCACAVVAPSLTLPYLSDDWAHLRFHPTLPSPLHAAVTPASGELWYRPITWICWWILGRLSPVDGFAGHAFCVFLSGACAWLVAPVLRRIGVPRGVAFVAALFYALHSAMLETSAWITNFELLLSTFFALAAILMIPRGRATAARWAPALLLTVAAIFSKETIYPIPAAAFFAWTRMRPGRLRGGLLAALPFAVIVGAAAGLRLYLLGGVGGYVDPITGQKMLSGASLAAVATGILPEYPSAYWVPVRAVFPGGALAAAAAAAPMLLFAFAAPTRRARTLCASGLILFAALLSVTMPKLPVGDLLMRARHLFAPSIGLSLTAAALCVSIPAPLGARRAVIAAYAALLACATICNFREWHRAGEALRTAVAAAAPALRALPQGARVVAYNLPDEMRGIGMELEFALPRSVGRPDLEFSATYSATFTVDAVYLMDWEKKQWRDLTEPHPARALACPGETRFDFSRAEDRDALVFEDDPPRREPPPAWIGRRQGTSAATPVLSLAGARRISVVAEGSVLFPDGSESAPPILITWRAGNAILRRVVPQPGQAFDVPSGATWVRFELLAMNSPASAARALVVRAEK